MVGWFVYILRVLLFTQRTFRRWVGMDEVFPLIAHLFVVGFPVRGGWLV
jgi:hypothetical protein